MSEADGGGPLGMDASTMLAIGGFVLVFAAVAVGATIWTTPILAYICVPGGILPGAALLGWGLLEHRREKHLQEFATWIRAYRRISMDDLARRLGKSSMEAERDLAQAMDRGLVKGVIDRSTDEFVLAGSEGQQVFLERCPHCCGTVNRWGFPQERFTCPYCNTPVEVPGTAAATP